MEEEKVMDGTIAGIGTLVLGLIGWFVLRGRTPKDDQRPPRPPGPGKSAARRERIRKAQEAKTREKLKKVDARPNTNDAVADLEARLGGGTATAGNGHGPGGSPAPSDSTD